MSEALNRRKKNASWEEKPQAGVNQEKAKKVEQGFNKAPEWMSGMKDAFDKAFSPKKPDNSGV